MKRIYGMLLTVLLALPGMLNANEAPDTKTAEGKIILKWTEDDGDIKEKKFIERKHNRMRQSDLKEKDGYYLYRMGKTLTFSGIGFMIAGSTMTGLSVVAAAAAIYEISWLTGTAVTYSSLWEIVSLGLSSGSGYIHLLLGTSVFFLSLGITFSVLGLLILPGLIIWGAGASKLSRHVKPLENQAGFAIRF